MMRTRSRPYDLLGWPRIGLDGGQALVEFLIAAPILVLLVSGIIEGGAAWQTHRVATSTAREGARLTTLPNADEIQVRADMSRLLTQGGFAPGSATIDFICAGGDCFQADQTAGAGAEVRISYPFNFVFLGPIADYVTGAGSAYRSITMQTGFVMESNSTQER